MEPGHSERPKDARVALVSGCSSGIGNVTARHLAQAGWTVFAGLRRIDSESASTHAAALASAGVHPLPLDVTDQAQSAAAIERISRETGRLDALINNAGIDHLAPLEEQTDQALRSVMEVNFFGAMALTRLALPLLRPREGSAIIMLSSLSGLLGLPGSSAYCASKFALEGATEALRNEVGRFGVHVALIEPGGYASAMSAKRTFLADLKRSSVYFPMLEHLASAPAPTADPVAVADLILNVIDSGAPQLRYPAGNQADAVAASLATLDDTARQRYARTVTDLEWWNHGKSSPS